jgi:hypothetical protein
MRRWVKRIVIVLVAVVLPAIGFYFYAGWQGERELREMIAELDAQGEPWRWDDLQASRPKGPDDERVRALMLKVCAAVPSGLEKKFFSGRTDQCPPNVVLVPDDAETYSEAMKELDPIAAEALAISNMPGGRYVMRQPNGILSSGGDNLLRLLAFSRLLHVAAVWHAHQGDLAAAADDCLAMQSAGKALEDECNTMAQLVRIATHTIALNSAERILAQGQPPPEKLKRLQEALEQSGIEGAMTNAIRGERAHMHRLYEALEAGEISFEQINYFMSRSASLWNSLTDWYQQSNVKHAHAWSLRHTTSILQALHLPDSQRTAALHAIMKETTKAPYRAGGTYLVGQVIEEQRIVARNRCAIVGIALERYRQSHDRWPQALDDLCPKFLASIPEDPCTGLPLKYRVSADGVVVFSVGPDGNLGGNFRDRPGGSNSDRSYEFRLWNVPQRRQLVAAKP